MCTKLRCVLIFMLGIPIIPRLLPSGASVIWTVVGYWAVTVLTVRRISMRNRWAGGRIFSDGWIEPQIEGRVA